MSWNNVLSTGNGELEFRVKVSGLDYEFVTNSLMEGNQVGEAGETIKRRVGLKRRGFNITERAIVPDCKVEIEGNSFTIVDVDQQATRAFRRQASRTAQLMNGFVSDTETTFRITTNNLSNGAIYWIGSEAIRINSVALGPLPGGGYAYAVLRGALGTRAVYHYTVSDLEKTVRPTIQNIPFGIENQRVWLYAYGKGDDLQGEGTLIWKGVVIQDASFDGMDWRFEAGSILEIFKGDFGIDSDAIRFRGINIVGQFGVNFRRYDTQYETGTVSDRGFIAITNRFFETKEDFINELNRQVNLNPVLSTWGVQKPQFQIGLDGQLVATFSTQTGESKFVEMNVVHNQQTLVETLAFNVVRQTGSPAFGQWAHPHINNFGVYKLSETDGTNISFVQPGKSYFLLFADTFPDQWAGFPDGLQRVYLNSPVVSFANELTLYDADDEKVFSSGIYEFNSSNNSIVISINLLGSERGANPIVINNNSSVLLSRKFFAPASTLPGFLSEIVELSKQFGSQGIMPLFYDDDFNLTDIQSQFDQYIIPTPIKTRVYRIIRPSQTFEEFITEEFKLAGCYPVTSLDGSITIRRLREVSPQEPKNHVLNANNILTDESFPVLITNKDGIWNSISVKTGWNSFKEEHLGTTYVNDIDAISKFQGKTKRIEITPYSGDSSATSVNEQAWADYILPLSERTLSFIREKYEIVSVEVPMTLFSSSIGDTVSIQSKQLPSVFTLEGDNFRGQSVFNGFIVGRTFNLDEGSGRLDIFVCNESIPATMVNLTTEYVASTVIAPVVPVLSSSISGSYLDVLVNDLASKLPAGTTFPDLFSADDRVLFTEWDSDNPYTDSARFDSTYTSGGDLYVRVEFPGAIPSEISSNSENFRLSFDKLDSGFDMTTNQLGYTYVDSGIKETSIETPVGNIIRKLTI